MLYIYGTVYNSRKRVLQSLNSIIGIKIEKSVYIVDNYSSDGTFELLRKNQDKYNMVVIAHVDGAGISQFKRQRKRHLMMICLCL